MLREWMKLVEAPDQPIEEKKRHHHHAATSVRYGWVRGIYACPSCGSHIPAQHVGDSCPVCQTPVASAGDAGGAAPAT